MLKLSSIIGVMSLVQIRFHTWRSGTLAGVDSIGNKYYKAAPKKGMTGVQRERRWVMYINDVNASEVPPEWHGWLHHQTNVIPGKTVKDTHRQDWQVPHKPNMTGTDEAYFPQGHPSQEGTRPKATGDYEAWVPPQ